MFSLNNPPLVILPRIFKPMSKLFAFVLLAGCFLATSAFAGHPEMKAEMPPEPVAEPWRFNIGVPAWVAWQQGTMAINGAAAKLKLGPNDIDPKADLLVAVRADAHKGRFGIMMEYSYLDTSDGVGVKGLVNKLDTRTDQHQGEVALSWRVIQGERGWVDVFAGARYSNMYQQLILHQDDAAIDSASQRFVDDVSDRLAAALRAALQPVIERRIDNALTAVQNRQPLLPQGPIGDAIRLRALQRVQTILDQRKAELDGAIRSGVRARIDAAKDKLSSEIASALKKELNTTVSRTDQWVDPFIGIKARYYLTKPLYITARADVGGFGAGADISWQVNAGLGCQLTRNIYSELTWRSYYIDYDNDGLFYRTFTYGAELTTGVSF
jgi:hypothetical protein